MRVSYLGTKGRKGPCSSRSKDSEKKKRWIIGAVEPWVSLVRERWTGQWSDGGRRRASERRGDWDGDL